jgi:hypothetical protein
MSKKMLTAALVAGAVFLSPAAAWADHCANLSRGAGNAVPWETVRGRWSFIAPDVGEIWVFDTPDNFHDRRSDGLLDGSGACNASRLQGQTGGDVTIDSLKGIWSEECVNEALGLSG